MKKLIIASCAVLLTCVFGFGCQQVMSVSNNKAYVSNTVNVLSDEYADYDSSEPTTRGIYTALSLSINGADGKVWATVKNDFTLFPATVIVIVELYSSDTYYESYTQMTLTSRNTIDDLNMGNTIKAEASTGGVQKYWQARMRYKIDNKAWEERVTDSLLFDANGNYIKEY